MSAYFVAHNNSVIFGIGTTPSEAIKDSTYYTEEDNPNVRVSIATRRLVDLVDKVGGAVCWKVLTDGTLDVEGDE